MTFTVIMLLCLAIVMEIAREVLFKIAANKSENEPKAKNYLVGLFGAPLVWLGFACWGIELIAWIQVLSRMPLSVAFPMMSVCYVGLIIASKYVLKEKVSGKKWLGVVLITAGVALIGSLGVA